MRLQWGKSWLKVAKCRRLHWERLARLRFQSQLKQDYFQTMYALYCCLLDQLAQLCDCHKKWSHLHCHKRCLLYQLDRLLLRQQHLQRRPIMSFKSQVVLWIRLGQKTTESSCNPRGSRLNRSSFRHSPLFLLEWQDCQVCHTAALCKCYSLV